jgi:hypothetical protein
VGSNPPRVARGGRAGRGREDPFWHRYPALLRRDAGRGPALHPLSPVGFNTPYSLHSATKFSIAVSYAREFVAMQDGEGRPLYLAQHRYAVCTDACIIALLKLTCSSSRCSAPGSTAPSSRTRRHARGGWPPLFVAHALRTVSHTPDRALQP